MVATFARDEFLEDIWDYRPGESVLLAGPTGAGKSHLAWQLADKALKQHPGLSLTTMCPKPTDDTTDRFCEQFGIKISDRYPFRKKFWENEPRGYCYWPPHIKGDADANEQHLSKAFRDCLNGEYWNGNRLVLVDDTYLIGAVYKANKDLDTYLVAGRSNKAGIISCLQQPRGTVHSGSVSSFHYSQPVHMFFSRENAEANREKYGEIACGLDPRMIMSIVSNLRTYRVGDSNVSDMLYLSRSGPYAAVITPW
jgi:energy-coupling factor transporter ATP-binding protein EcfA2